MSLILCNNGKISLLSSFDAQQSATLKLRLYQNNYTPVEGSVLGDFTEATFSGYAQATPLVAVDITGPDGTNRWTITWSQCSWTKNGATGNQIYGYYVLNAANQVLFAERFGAAPIDMTVNGNHLQLTPKLTMKSQFQ